MTQDETRRAIAAGVVFTAILIGFMSTMIVALLWATRPPVHYTYTSWVDGAELCIGSSLPAEVGLSVNRNGPVDVTIDWHRAVGDGADSIPGTASTFRVNALSETVADPDIIIRAPEVVNLVDCTPKGEE